MNEGRERQGTASGSKGMGEKHRGVEQADKNINGKEEKAQRRDDTNTRSDNGEGTTGK